MTNTPHTPSALGLVRWLTGITRPVHAPLFASTLCRIATQLLDIALFTCLGFTVASALTGTFSGSTILLLAALALARAITHYIEQFTGHYVAFKALEVLRVHAYSTLWPKAPAITQKEHSGALLTNLTRDVDRIEVIYAHTFAPLVSALVVPLTAVLYTGFTISWQLIPLPAFALLLATFLVPALGLKKAVAFTENTLKARSNLTTHISDSAHGAAEILTYDLKDDRATSMALLDSKLTASAIVPARIKADRRASNLLLSLFTLGALVYSSLHLNLDPVIATALVAGATRIFEPAKGIENATGYLNYSLSAARSLWHMCHTPSTINDGHRVLSLDAPPRLEWRAVSYRYPGASQPALTDVSITIEPGTHTVLLGHSGSGKTTAAQLLLRFDDPTKGQILLNNTDIREFTLDSLRSALVLVPQKAQMLTGSIAENLRLGTPDATDTQLWAALETACLADEIRAFPKALATEVGVGGTELSGGQLQRLALARALLLNPKVLVLDEFTANLNTELETRVRERLSLDHPNISIIEISHRTDHLRPEAGQHVVTFERGQLCAS